MKYLKYYESINEIDRICEEYDIENYTINKDGSIDVNGDVYLSNFELIELPLKFNYVSGDFSCWGNQLTTLEGAPESVSGNFNCGNNKLTTLEGAPESVSGNFNCQINKLTNLVGAPKSVGGDFNCTYNEYLTSLIGAPLNIGSRFKCVKTPVYAVWKLFNDKDKLGMFNDYYDPIRDNSTIILFRLNEFLEDIGKPPVESVKGYTMI